MSNAHAQQGKPSPYASNSANDETMQRLRLNNAEVVVYLDVLHTIIKELMPKEADHEIS